MRGTHLVGESRGFTLIELMIVVAVIIITSAVVVPSVGRTITERHVYSLAVQLQQDLREVQQTATATRVPASLIMGSLSTSYTFVRNGTTIVRQMPSSFSVVATGYSGNMTFDAFGHPTVTYTAPPASIHIVASAAGKEIAVNVSQVLGMLSITWITR